MTVTELTKEQLIQLKIAYLYQLADCGEYDEIMGVGYDEPSYNDIANVDDLISDDFILEHFESFTFSEDDFY